MLASVIDELEGCGAIVYGDFNACIGGTCYQHGVSACEEYELTYKSYTSVNSCSLSRSQVDHCFSSQTVHRYIFDISIDYNYHESDHFPILVNLRIPSIQRVQNAECDSYHVKGVFCDKHETDRFFNLIKERLAASNLNHHYFFVICTVDSHRKRVDYMWAEFTKIVLDSDTMVYGESFLVNRNRPGSNT